MLVPSASARPVSVRRRVPDPVKGPVPATVAIKVPTLGVFVAINDPAVMEPERDPPDISRTLGSYVRVKLVEAIEEPARLVTFTGIDILLAAVAVKLVGNPTVMLGKTIEELVTGEEADVSGDVVLLQLRLNR